MKILKYSFLRGSDDDTKYRKSPINYCKYACYIWILDINYFENSSFML